ncbi:MAG: hypothetical protein ACJAS9_000365 [Polaribacter sp.]|jgi:hypothetical protein
MCEEAKSQLNGLVPSEKADSCGTDVFKNEPQFFSDTLNDTRWSGFLPYLKEFAISACWSVAIFDRQKRVIGSVDLSSYETWEPNNFQKNILFAASKLISLILIRQKDEQALHHSAHYDALTDLANRIQTSLAIFFMDLDGFKKSMTNLDMM